MSFSAFLGEPACSELDKVATLAVQYLCVRAYVRPDFLDWAKTF